MNEIIVFRKDERNIISAIRETLGEEEKKLELNAVENNIHSLEELARSISLYPSILGTQHLGSASRSVETLVETLCVRDIMDLLLHVPTKAILGKGYSVAKVNLFFMLLYLSREEPSLRRLEDGIIDIATRNVYGVMAEEVYLSLIADREIPLHVRTNAAYNLARIWEHRIDCGVKEFAPILGNLWGARKKLKPAFGTLLGLSELFMLTERSDDNLAEFFESDEIDDNILYALQEFLMGLSYEEMRLLMAKMEESGKSSLSMDEIDQILGEGKIHPRYTYSDPREIYRSFRLRKKNAQYRTMIGLPGPKKTIEESLMSFLLVRPAIGGASE